MGAIYARSPDLAAVGHEGRMRMNQAGEVMDSGMGNTVSRAVIYEKSRGVARFCRFLGDQFFGKMVIEVTQTHVGEILPPALSFFPPFDNDACQTAKRLLLRPDCSRQLWVRRPGRR